MYKTVYAEVEIDLGDFETDDLLDELESRGALPIEGSFNSKELLEKIYYKRRTDYGDYQAELDQLIYASLGRVV